MKHREVMTALKAAGTGQNRKVYTRHGVTRQMFGVSFAELGKLQKKIRCDQKLAERLWASGNHDARVLATMVLDPDAMKSSQWDAWAKELDNYVISDAFSKALAKSSHAETKMKKWMNTRAEFIGQAAWNLVAIAAMRDEDRPDSWFAGHLESIEQRIHRAPNRVRHSMNMALIAIGTRNRTLHTKALAAAKRIGTVQVDHGETGCTTPPALPYMERTWDRKDAKRAQAQSSRKTGGPTARHGRAKG